MMSQRIWFCITLIFLGVFLVSCSAAAPEQDAEAIIVEKEGETTIIIVEPELEDQAPAVEEPAAEAPAEEEAPAPPPTPTLGTQGAASPTQQTPTEHAPTPLVERASSKSSGPNAFIWVIRM